MVSTVSISAVHLLNPKRNNTAAIAISWVTLSSQGRLNSGDGFREKGRGPRSLPCWNQNFHVGNPMLMKTLSLAGGWCWYPFSTVPRISHTFTLFALLSSPLPSLAVSEKPLQMVPTTPCTRPGTFYPFFFFFHCWLSHLSVSTSNAWSGTNVQRTLNSLLPTSLSSSHSSTLCLLWDLR